MRLNSPSVVKPVESAVAGHRFLQGLNPEHLRLLWDSAMRIRYEAGEFFYGTRLREQCEQDHDFGYEMMRRMTQVMIHRLQATRKELLSLRR